MGDPQGTEIGGEDPRGTVCNKHLHVRPS